MKVYELCRGWEHGGKWHVDRLNASYFTTLELAQAQITAVPWVKRARQRAWDTEHHDIIFERNVEGGR